MDKNKRKWWMDSVVYQIYPRSFKDSNGDGIGDLKGIIEKVDYLSNLGIDVLWISPFFDSPNDDNGYDIRDYKKILNEFGNMEDFETLLSKLKEKGIKLVMDLVVNHSSDENMWFVESKKSKDNPYRDYYIWKQEKNDWNSVFSGSAWEFDEKTKEYYLHAFSKKQPDLNWENENLRQEIYSMMKFWLEKGVSGFRMDVINLISKHFDKKDSKKDYFFNGPKVHDYLQEMNREVLKGKDLITVGECPGASTEDAVLFAGFDRDELNMIFTFEHMDLDSGSDGKWELLPFDLLKLKNSLSNWQRSLHGKAWNSLYLNNHDQPRMVSRFGDDHEYRVESAKMLANLIHFMEGTPYIYQGEEIGMTNYPFKDMSDIRDLESIRAFDEFTKNKGYSEEKMMDAIRAKGRDNARTPMQWDDSLNAGFTEGTPWININPNYKRVNVEHDLSRKDSIYNYYKKLISLRRKHDVIKFGEYRLILEDSKFIYGYTREYENEKLIILCNFTRDKKIVDISDETKNDNYEILISNYVDRVEKPFESTILRPYESFVLRKVN